ncbi:hypothetical protein ACQP3F_27570, partial [Escherichia coli]
LRRKPEEQMWKMCMYTREFYLAVKIITSAGKWMGLASVLSKIKWSNKVSYIFFHDRFQGFLFVCLVWFS